MILIFLAEVYKTYQPHSGKCTESAAGLWRPDKQNVGFLQLVVLFIPGTRTVQRQLS